MSVTGIDCTIVVNMGKIDGQGRRRRRGQRRLHLLLLEDGRIVSSVCCHSHCCTVIILFEHFLSHGALVVCLLYCGVRYLPAKNVELDGMTAPVVRWRTNIQNNVRALDDLALSTMSKCQENVLLEHFSQNIAVIGHPPGCRVFRGK